MVKQQFVEPPVWTLYDPDRVGDEQFFIDPETGRPFWTYHSQVAELTCAWAGGNWQVSTINDALAPPEVNPWSQDLTGELARNPGPYTNRNLIRDGGWWPRTIEQIVGGTIHHTCSDSPQATARYCVNTKDLPSIQYHIWVTQTGEIILCVPLTEGLWHDNTGHENRTLSIGMAGTLHLYRPVEVQLQAAARVCEWAIKTLPGVSGIEAIKGHQDYHETQCPGWDMRKGNEGSGQWKDDFYRILEGLLLSS